MEKTILKPFLKWAGGKSQILSEIRKTYPAGLGRSITKYAEPFVGSGAVLFDILSRHKLDEVYISDINEELICAYRTIRDDVEGLIGLLSEMRGFYSAHPDEGERSLYYYEKRGRFNHLKTQGLAENDVEKAALMIFLNRTCFNGLYRVNSKGLFNVPKGNYKNPGIYDERNLRNISEALKNVRIVCGDYKASEAFIDSKTFAYFDPPYRPLTKTSAFTSYTENGFDDTAQKELALFVDHLSRKGARLTVSNSDPKNVDQNDDFFDKLYEPQKIVRVYASRMINSNGDNRGRISELLIGNF